MSNSSKEPQIIIIKKVRKKHNAHHGGSWKIAYADFVTAMMAFFLLMWLLSMLNKFQLMGISNYFSKPLKNVFVDNKKNDVKQKKVPDENTKKYKLQLINEEKVQIDAHSRGMDKEPLKVIANEDLKKIVKNTNQVTQEEELKKLKEKLERKLKENSNVAKYKDQVDFTIVKDGLKIRLQDLENKPMFSLGKVDFESHASHILNWLSQEINESGYKVTIIGHTDTRPYANSLNYSNWELSADRANATRRVLIKYGVSEEKIIRIQGASDSVLLDKKSGENPKNRRIEIILLTDEAVKRLLEG
ncbi:hypothetical protein EP47_05030 [Legionella norrlandica]|uniref:OmpA-like domain-containing protein n=1 Tax=Legionella norrlandica TaxID=1498499 RepID=A0A0A2T8G6_9GAMM|nr:flagellar motor protein MotB [Legionella norrlandica]KGP63728.1 hypothetical protein EP47_05030 [Legionella norrlandica]